MTRLLSIIIPVYNVEPYIRTCLESIFSQGLTDDTYEIIVVNDGTTDRSMEKISDLIHHHNNIITINQENQGLSVARNNGFLQATGEYILFLDSDDFLIDGALPLLLERTMSSKPDISVADFISLRKIDVSTPSPKILEHDYVWEEKTGREMFLVFQNLFKATVWHGLYRREFLQNHHILFEPGIYYEDVPFTHECYLKADRCMKTDLPLLFHRSDRVGSITSLFTQEHARSLSIAIGKTWNLKKAVHLNEAEYQILQKSVFVRFNRVVSWSIANLSWPERYRAMSHLRHSAPDLTFSLSSLQKLITLIYRISPHLLISLWAFKLKILPHQAD